MLKRKQLKRNSEKFLIKFIFLLPFITCVGTGIMVKQFMDHQILQHPELLNIWDYREVFDVVLICLFVNAVASFISLMFYFCLESKAKGILKRLKDR